MSCSYNPSRNSIKTHLDYIGRSLDYFLNKYENILIIGDFNVEISNSHMSDFSQFYNLKSLINEPTCYKNSTNPSCIDLIFTNQSRSFCHSKVVDIGLSDFHLLTVTVLRSSFKKQEPRIIRYRNFSKFSNEEFQNLLIQDLSERNIPNDDFKSFQNTILNLLDKHVPIKKKYIRRNNSAFVDKAFRKEIMKRSRLFNTFKKKKNKYNDLC